MCAVNFYYSIYSFTKEIVIIKLCIFMSKLFTATLRIIFKSVRGCVVHCRVKSLCGILPLIIIFTAALVVLVMYMYRIAFVVEHSLVGLDQYYCASWCGGALSIVPAYTICQPIIIGKNIFACINFCYFCE